MNTQLPSRRLESLDAFRGATIAGMILVNSPGSPDHAPAALHHAAWNGWTFADWIFPFFLFIVGVAMTISFQRRIENGIGKRKLVLHAARRSLILFGLGLLVNGFPFDLNPDFSWHNFRIPGVLQRIAVCYFVVTLVILWSSVKIQIVWATILLLGYWLAMALIPVPGFGAGILEPTGNLAWYIDSNLLAGHTWVHAPAPGFDPEGLLSTLPAIGTTLIGALTGHLVQSSRPTGEKALWMFVGGNLLVLAGTVADVWFPINKNLWSTSFVLFTGGWALIVFATCLWLIDGQGYKKPGKPFVILGMNAIAVYVLSELLWSSLWAIRWEGEGGIVYLQEFLFTYFFAPLAHPTVASVLFSIVYLGLMIGASWVLWSRRVFIKI